MPIENDTNKLQLIPPQRAAERLGVSTSTLAKWRLTGAGPSYLKVGAKIAYDSRLIDEWLATRIRRSTSERKPLMRGEHAPGRKGGAR